MENYLAGYLIADGVVPCSVQQLFRDTSGSEPVLVKTDTVAGTSLAMKVIRYVNHSDKMIGKDVCDAVVEWR